MSTAWVVLQPLDVLTFRDGRPFSAGLTALARSTFPRPTSTGGAIKALFGAEPARIHGPLLADVGPPAALLLPAPADIVVDRVSGAARRLHPDDLPEHDPGVAGLVCDLDGVDSVNGPGRLRLPHGSGEPAQAFLDTDALGRYLAGDPADALDTLSGGGAATAPERLVSERRVGLARHARSHTAGRTAVPGFLYLAEFLRFPPAGEDRIGFACRVEFDDRVPAPRTDVVRFGGEGRQARVTVWSSDEDRSGEPGGQGGPGEPLSLPDPPPDVSDGRVLLYLASPAVFTGGWMPPLDSGARLVAACVTGPEPVASQAFRLRWAVAAGSVYFLQFTTGPAASRFVETYHNTCLPQAHERLRTVGFGLCLTGRW
ncbi:MAG TPA: type III-B CRISPR module-associated Cmr3 family protein [Mycobacteriales bacterium]|nr:type III-B CRISPR module-associated Cmr3 family protein [Mycobacteriales bacterium]